MNIHDILGSHSSEVQELFYILEKAETHIREYVENRKPIISDNVFLDNNEVCELLHLSPRTLQDYRDKRLIAFYKLEGKILYKMSDIEHMLKKNYFDTRKKK